MRKHAFRPTLSASLESRLVLSAAGGVTPLTIYKADLVGNVQNELYNIQSELNTAFGGGPSSGFSLNGAAATQYTMIQGSLVAGINNAGTNISDLLSPLKKSKNLIATVQGELSSLATQVNGLLTQLNATRTTTNNVTSSVDSNSASLAQTTISDMESSVYLAISNQIQLFNFAPGVATKPGKAFLAASQSAASSALAPAFSALSTGIQNAYTAYINPNAQVPFDTQAYDNAIYAAIGTFNTTATSALASSSANPRVAARLIAQVGGLDGSSVDQTIVGWTSSLSTSKYPTGFVTTALTALDSTLEANLAATASA